MPVRRLDDASGKFAGVIAASYDTNSFVRLGHSIELGTPGIIGVVSMQDGRTWTLTAATQATNVA